jgi:protein TonB
MTVPFPLDAFDDAKLVVQRSRARRDSSRLISIGITVALHAAVIGVALSAAHVVRQKAPEVLKVEITETKRELPKVLAPPPKMQQPSVITAVAPEFTVRSQSPITAPPPAAKPAPVQQVSAPSPVAGEGRDAYLGRLLAQLNRYKQYPVSARKARITGVVMLHFVMDAQGKVLSFEIAKSSGRPILDAEALALIQRAQPLPALPADFPTRTLDAIVPVEFTLNS